MATLNQCSFIGHLGKEPDMSYTQNGNAVTKFSLAVNQGKDRPALWLTIVCWNELAERMNTMLFKGAQVFVQGRLAPHGYTDREGVARQALDIVATMVQLLEKSQKRSEETGAESEAEDVPS